ncbi:FAST kinase domain-containing protein 4 [Uranotaenia lowii]|uniref:FAST kinase domain-containing protein 4 n=1 Tax=Uranotaenia lowii TaxID=190385 RepID=UPI0024786CF2|nr:FAST kinase domain-containing protein 4 [Uranotaenia lowii]XP_055586691.1 FAST kinase domain-containing protein 4 [Uranotaenia lowii]
MINLPRIGQRLGFSVFKRNFSAPVAPFASRVPSDESGSNRNLDADLTKPSVTNNKSRNQVVGLNPGTSTLSQEAASSKNPIVAAAFASLLQEDSSDDRIVKSGSVNADVDEKIINASTVNDLLIIPSQGRITRKQALKIVSILAEWSSIKKVKLADFENDNRFLQLCSVLGRTNNRNNGTRVPLRSLANVQQSSLPVDDLQTVLGVTANDEAAKLIAGLTLQQMIKVMTSLSQKKKRSTPLLRTLAFNISSSTSKLNLKECGDLLYAMATLNFRDTVLTARICGDVETELVKNENKPAPVSSILTSLSLLRYRDSAMLDSLSDWVVKNNKICKPSHVSTLLLSLATLSYEPSNMDQLKSELIASLSESDFIKPIDWLNTVWSLAVLGSASEKNLASVLKTSFIANLENDRNGELSPSIKMKLLNLNGCLSVTNQKTDLNVSDPKFFVPLDASKDKRILIAGMLDALKSLVPSESHVKINTRTKMGFSIDAECVLDSKCLPLAVDKDHPDAKRIALLVHDYHDMCQGPHPALNGVQTLVCRLLQQSGYSVLSIPYTEFNTSDKLLKRVEYLQKKFKTIVNVKP